MSKDRLLYSLHPHIVFHTHGFVSIRMNISGKGKHRALERQKADVNLNNLRNALQDLARAFILRTF